MLGKMDCKKGRVKDGCLNALCLMFHSLKAVLRKGFRGCSRDLAPPKRDVRACEIQQIVDFSFRKLI